MKYSQLLKRCQELIDSFNENIMTADSHAEQFLSKSKCEDTERVFLKQVFYGYQRYKGFLKVSNEVIFANYPTTTNRKVDYTMFAIFTYLIVFRLDELPFNEFKKMVLSQDMVKMNVLMNFIFDLEMLRAQVLGGWMEFLEKDYLEEKVFSALAESRNKCVQLISKVAENATGKRVEHTASIESMNNLEDIGKDKRKLTIIEQFKLTKPKPKQLPEVEKIEVGFKANPAPKSNKDLKKIQEEKKQRRDQIRNNVKTYYDEKKKENFELQTSKRPVNLPKLKQEHQQREKMETMLKTYSRPVPKFQEVDVKLNVAAILRQEKKLNQKIQQEELRMRNLEINMRDESEFESWQKEMKEKDKYDQMEAQQRRKIQMELAREAAIEAFSDKIQQNKMLVDDMKEIAAQLREERQKLQVEELINKKKVIEQVQQIKQNIKVQQEKVIEKNRKLHHQEKEERRRIQDKKKEQEKIEMQKKKDLIREIKQLEKNIRAKPKTQIQYISIGLLQEMTLDDLKYRLQNVKQQRKQQQQKKRQQNIQKKESFKQTISQKKTNILQARQELTKQKEDQRKKKKEQLQTEKRRLEESKMKSLNEYKKKEEDKIKQRKRQKERLAKEIKQTEQRRMFLMQGQAAQQNNAFMNLQKGEEREILDRQNYKLMEEYKGQTIKEGEISILAQQGKKAVQQKIEFNKLYNEQMHQDNQMAETLKQEDQVVKATQYHNARSFEQKHTQNLTKINPYKTKIAQLSLSKAKTKN